MTENQMNAALDMLYLCGCALAHEKPHTERLSKVDLKELYAVSKFHSLTALVCEGLGLAQLMPTDEDREYRAVFQKAKEKSVRKNLMLDTERAKILAFMEQLGVWYMPLKGVVLKDMYPKIGLRQMADNDILFDKAYREAIKDWFSGQGYEVKSYGISNHDVYLKKPIYNYEMHISLYGESHSSEWQNYYEAVKERLVKDLDNDYGYHFTDEDFYIYFLTHGFKHFDGSGNGLRFLCDLYVYLEAKQTTMDFAYINRELQTLELTDFERNCRALVAEIFGDIHMFAFEKLPQDHQEMLTYFLSGGTYGTMEQRIQRGVNKQGKLKYLLRRLFPGTEVLITYHPAFRHKWLMPIGYIYRAFMIITSREDKAANAMREFKTILKTKRN